MRVQATGSGDLGGSVAVAVVSTDPDEVISTLGQALELLEEGSSSTQVGELLSQRRTERTASVVLNQVLGHTSSSVVTWGTEQNPQLGTTGDLQGDTGGSSRDDSGRQRRAATLRNTVSNAVDRVDPTVVGSSLGQATGARHLQGSRATSVGLSVDQRTASSRDGSGRSITLVGLGLGISTGGKRLTGNSDNEVAASVGSVVQEGDAPRVASVAVRSVPVHDNTVSDNVSQIVDLTLHTSASPSPSQGALAVAKASIWSPLYSIYLPESFGKTSRVEDA